MKRNKSCCGELWQWTWSEGFGCFVYPHNYHECPREFVHADFGVSAMGENYRGSSVGSWHTSGFGIDLKRAVEWVSWAMWGE
jgi:hypothetical protein